MHLQKMHLSVNKIRLPGIPAGVILKSPELPRSWLCGDKWRVKMIKDILVTLPIGKAPPIALDYAVTVAGAFDAHLTGVALVQSLASTGAMFDGATAAVFDHYLQEAEAAAEVANVRFEQTRQREGLSAESIVLNAATTSLPELLARTARRFDLTILPQADPEDDGSEETIIEAALLGSGRPTLIVPHFQEGGVKFERVLVCWDGSHNAARAIADAMPFLARAKQVEVITVFPDEKFEDDMAGLPIAQHLSRHGVNVEVRSILAHGQDVSLRIRAHAAEQSADLIVMGCYGHSRLREFILGGVTRDMLGSTHVPTLMSH
jgi:nucleotide-binding universal stress UspA family protein